MFGGDTEWTPLAYLTIEALQIYEDSVCSGCGQSAFLAYDNEEAGGDFGVHRSVCEGCAALESNQSKHPAPGEKTYVRNEMFEDEDDDEAPEPDDD